MRAFDFDHTIYDGYSYRDFVFFTTARRPWVLLWLPVIIVVLLLKVCRLIKMKHVVEWVLWPYLRFKRIDEFIVKFWDKNEKKVGKWYLDMREDDDVVISATPSFFLEEICRRIGVKTLIATEIDRKTGKVVDPYCYREGKLERLRVAFGDSVRLQAYYTDTPKDSTLLGFAEEGYIVKKGKITRVR